MNRALINLTPKFTSCLKDNTLNQPVAQLKKKKNAINNMYPYKQDAIAVAAYNQESLLKGLMTKLILLETNFLF